MSRKTETEQDDDTGEITGVQNSGTIVVVYLTTEQGRVVPIYFDRSPFRWLCEGEQCTPDELLGRTATYDGENIRFID